MQDKIEERELARLRVRDALLWLEEASLNMRKRLDGKGDHDIGKESDTTALYIKAVLESRAASAVDQGLRKALWNTISMYENYLNDLRRKDQLHDYEGMRPQLQQTIAVKYDQALREVEDAALTRQDGPVIGDEQLLHKLAVAQLALLRNMRSIAGDEGEAQRFYQTELKVAEAELLQDTSALAPRREPESTQEPPASHAAESAPQLDAEDQRPPSRWRMWSAGCAN